MRRSGAPCESMSERSEFRFAAPMQSRAARRSADLPGGFFRPLFGRSKRGHPSVRAGRTIVRNESPGRSGPPPVGWYG